MYLDTFCPREREILSALASGYEINNWIIDFIDELKLRLLEFYYSSLSCRDNRIHLCA